jgi:hypothetical protein
MRYWFFLLGLPALLNAEIVWQADIQKPFVITIKLSSQQIPRNGVLDLDAEFHYPSSYELKVDDVLDQLIWSANPLAPQLHLNQSSIYSIPAEEGLQTQRLHAKISPLAPGPLDLSLLTVTFLPKENAQLPLHILTPIFNLQVLPLATQKAPLSFAPLIPLEPQFPLDLTQANRQFLIDNPERLEEEKRRIQCQLEQHTFPWLTMIILLGCGGIGWAAYLTREFWSKRRLKPVTVLSPKQQAHQALSTLQGRHFLEKNLIQTYYTELASILLTALQHLLKRKTQELTTTELAQVLSDEATFSQKQKQEILSILAEIDQVKFADKKPSLETAREMHQRIQNVIE